MAANDAFTAGVRPGGLTSSTEIRLLLCYLVKNAGPIARQEIENALMEEALVNYFEIGSCLDDITKQPYAKWLEESIATIAGLDPCCICFAATKADGTVFTGYYNADATDKAVFAHNIQSDIVMDIIKANADTISGILGE